MYSTAYDNLGDVKSTTTPQGHVTQIQRDLLGRTVATINPENCHTHVKIAALARRSSGVMALLNQDGNARSP